MSILSRLGEKALTTGVNAALPVAAKVAGAVSELSKGPAGKVVGSVLEKGQELASPVLDPVLRKIGHATGSSAPKVVPDVQQAAADAVSSNGSAATAPNKKSPAKKTSAKKPPAKKTTAKSTRKPSGDPSRKVVPQKTHKAEAVTHADVVSPAAPDEVDEMSLPIVGYSRIAADKIPARLVGLTNSELALLFKFERANKNRSKISDAIEAQLVDLPMPTYDKMTSTAILDSLNGLTRGELRTIREYESRTTNRLPILDRVDELLAIDV